MNDLIDSNIETLYSKLNTLFSINYSCLQIANQEGVLNPTVRTGRDVFYEKSLSSVWLSSKMKEMSEIRRQAFCSIESKNQHIDSHSNIQQELLQLQNKLIDAYNNHFNTNKKFEEVFDGFDIKDQYLKQIIQKYHREASFYADQFSLICLVSACNEYLENYVYYCLYNSFRDIFDALSNDLASNGYPSLFYNKPSNKNITYLSENQIKDYAKRSSALTLDIEQEIQQKNRILAPLYKEARKKSRKKQDISSVRNQIDLTKFQIFKLLNEQSFINHLNVIINLINQRYVSANTNYGTEFANKSEKIVDFIFGVKKSKTPELKIDKVYAHKLELEYIEFLFDMLKERELKLTQNSTTNEKQL